MFGQQGDQRTGSKLNEGMDVLSCGEVGSRDEMRTLPSKSP